MSREFIKNIDYVKDERGCWIWIRTINDSGYGYFRIKGKNIRAHRYSYETHRGLIPEGIQVCHTCDVRRCINPDHLFLGNHRSNAKDASNKLRGGNQYGDQFGLDAIEWIMFYKDVKNLSYAEIGRILGMERHTVGNIYKRRSYYGSRNPSLPTPEETALA